MELIKEQLLDWYANEHDKGVSSHCMADIMIGKTPKDISHPIDPADLNRCLKFLKRVPLARKRLDEIAELSAPWKRIIDNFEKLENMYLEEVGFDWGKGKELKALHTYNYMKNVLKTW